MLPNCPNGDRYSTKYFKCKSATFEAEHYKQGGHCPLRVLGELSLSQCTKLYQILVNTSEFRLGTYITYLDTYYNCRNAIRGQTYYVRPMRIKHWEVWVQKKKEKLQNTNTSLLPKTFLFKNFLCMNTIVKMVIYTYNIRYLSAVNGCIIRLPEYLCICCE